MAKKIKQQMSITDFINSSGWLHHFKQGHGLSEHVKEGETSDKNAEVCKNIIAKTLKYVLKKSVSILNRRGMTRTQCNTYIWTLLFLKLVGESNSNSNSNNIYQQMH
jgi:hypothetical protein